MDKIYRIFTLLCVGLIILCSGCSPATSGEVNSGRSIELGRIEKQFDLLHIFVASAHVIEMHIPHEYGVYDVVRFEDIENGNICYIFADYSNIGAVSGFSCVKGE